MSQACRWHFERQLLLLLHHGSGCDSSLKKGWGSALLLKFDLF